MSGHAISADVIIVSGLALVLLPPAMAGLAAWLFRGQEFSQMLDRPEVKGLVQGNPSGSSRGKEAASRTS